MTGLKLFKKICLMDAKEVARRPHGGVFTEDYQTPGRLKENERFCLDEAANEQPEESDCFLGNGHLLLGGFGEFLPGTCIHLSLAPRCLSRSARATGSEACCVCVCTRLQ